MNRASPHKLRDLYSEKYTFLVLLNNFLLKTMKRCQDRRAKLPVANTFLTYLVFTTRRRRYANAEYAVVTCMSVCPSVRLAHASIVSNG